jgi:hypothetical protein
LWQFVAGYSQCGQPVGYFVDMVINSLETLADNVSKGGNSIIHFLQGGSHVIITGGVEDIIGIWSASLNAWRILVGC